MFVCFLLFLYLTSSRPKNFLLLKHSDSVQVGKVNHNPETLCKSLNKCLLESPVSFHLFRKDKNKNVRQPAVAAARFFRQEEFRQLFFNSMQQQSKFDQWFLSPDRQKGFSTCCKCALALTVYWDGGVATGPSMFSNTFLPNVPRARENHYVWTEASQQKSWMANLIQSLYWGETYCWKFLLLILLFIKH